jgi:GTP-binding protein EngB required for normal cell division
MNKILLLEKNISIINVLINNTAKSLDGINESYLHKNLNNEGWTLRHFICLLISLNKMILNLDKFNAKKINDYSYEKETRKYIGEEMFQLFNLRKDKLVEALQKCPKIKEEHVKQIKNLQEKIENLNIEKKIDLYSLINIKTEKINELSKKLDQINGYIN